MRRVEVVRVALVRVGRLLRAHGGGESHRHRYAAATAALQRGVVGVPAVAVVLRVVV